MGDVVGAKQDWERKEELAAAMVEFLEGWVIHDLCLHFRAIAEGLYSETAEHRLVGALLSAHEPLSLAEIANKCNVCKDFLYPGGRIRRALDRMERLGMVANRGGDKPRYSLDRSNLRVQLITKVFERSGREDGLVTRTLRERLGPDFE